MPVSVTLKRYRSNVLCGQFVAVSSRVDEGMDMADAMANYKHDSTRLSPVTQPSLLIAVSLLMKEARTTQLHS